MVEDPLRVLRGILAVLASSSSSSSSLSSPLSSSSSSSSSLSSPLSSSSSSFMLFLFFSSGVNGVEGSNNLTAVFYGGGGFWMNTATSNARVALIVTALAIALAAAVFYATR